MAAFAIGVLGLAACSAPQPAPTAMPPVVPTAVATPTFRPAVPATVAPPTPAPTLDPSAAPTVDTANADPVEVEVSFLSNVDDVIAQASDLASTPCPDLTSMAHDNPTLIRSVRGFAATLKRVGTTQAVLDTDAIKNALSDLDKSMGELEGALSLCGITQV